MTTVETIRTRYVVRIQYQENRPHCWMLWDIKLGRGFDFHHRTLPKAIRAAAYWNGNTDPHNKVEFPCRQNG